MIIYHFDEMFVYLEYDEDSGIITGVSDARKNSKAWGA
jgi:hypothetical protein